MNLLEVESLTEDTGHRIKQNLKFKTGKFIWRVRFTAPLNPATVNNVNMFVTAEESGSILRTIIRYNSETHEVEIEPLDPYAKKYRIYFKCHKKCSFKGRTAFKRRNQT